MLLEITDEGLLGKLAGWFEPSVFLDGQGLLKRIDLCEVLGRESIAVGLGDGAVDGVGTGQYLSGADSGRSVGPEPMVRCVADRWSGEGWTIGSGLVGPCSRAVIVDVASRPGSWWQSGGNRYRGVLLCGPKAGAR